MSETKLIPGTQSFLKPLKEFEKKQNKLVKNNPYIEISDTKSFESAKQSRTALVKGRTELQGQQKTINNSVNSIKTAVKEETERLIEITKPAEEKQQIEVKRYEAIQNESRIERERIAQEKSDAIKKQIDGLIDLWENDIKSLIYDKIDSFQQSFEEYFDKLDLSQFEDLEIYFSGKYASLNNLFLQKCTEIEKDQELLVSQSENRFQTFRNKWMERLMYANLNTIGQINIDFDTEVPEIDADTFFTYKDAFIEETKKLRSKLIDLTNVFKLQQDKADEAKKIEDTKKVISRHFVVIQDEIIEMTFEKIIIAANSISLKIDKIKESEIYDSFKDLIDLNISKVENDVAKRQDELEELNKKELIAAEEKKKLDKENEKKAAAAKKSASVKEKKRQKELNPEKQSAMLELHGIPKPEFKSYKSKEITEVLEAFIKDYDNLIKEVDELIQNL